MSRVLDRLLENAIRHTPAGGTIQIHAVKVVASDGHRHEEVLIQVIDTGKASPPAGMHIGFGLPLAAHVVRAGAALPWRQNHRASAYP